MQTIDLIETFILKETYSAFETKMEVVLTGQWLEDQGSGFPQHFSADSHEHTLITLLL